MEVVLKVLTVYYVIINICLFILMGDDKVRAKKGRWRIKEAVLLITALLGGGIGGILGMRLFHHKTKKWYFHAVFILGTVIHAVLLWYLKFRL